MQVLPKKKMKVAWELAEPWNKRLNRKSLFIQAPGSVVLEAEAENLTKAIWRITTEEVRFNN